MKFTRKFSWPWLLLLVGVLAATGVVFFFATPAYHWQARLRFYDENESLQYDILMRTLESWRDAQRHFFESAEFLESLEKVSGVSSNDIAFDSAKLWGSTSLMAVRINAKDFESARLVAKHAGELFVSRFATNGGISPIKLMDAVSYEQPSAWKKIHNGLTGAPISR